MIILGLDPGTATTGYGCIKNTKQGIETIDFGCIRTSHKKNDHQRLLEIFKDTEALLKKLKPDAVAIEELFFFKNAKTVIKVSEARGALVIASSQFGAEVYEYTPLQVKQALTSYGRAEKRQVQEMVQLVLGLNTLPVPDDAADALAIAICHQQSQ